MFRSLIPKYKDAQAVILGDSAFPLSEASKKIFLIKYFQQID
ncbi:MAG: hypothetical protein AB7F64_09795 [Gammaproteobacteria bacterium]